MTDLENQSSYHRLLRALFSRISVLTYHRHISLVSSISVSKINGIVDLQSKNADDRNKESIALPHTERADIQSIQKLHKLTQGINVNCPAEFFKVDARLEDLRIRRYFLVRVGFLPKMFPNPKTRMHEVRAQVYQSSVFVVFAAGGLFDSFSHFFSDLVP